MPTSSDFPLSSSEVRTTILATRHVQHLVHGIIWALTTGKPPMASKQSIVDFIVDQLSDSGVVTAKKMFGEYGVFLSGKMIALICDDKLFFKPTEQGRKLFLTINEGTPYPGAKPCFLVPEEDWDNRDWLTSVAKATFNELPIPKKKPKKGQHSA